MKHIKLHAERSFEQHTKCMITIIKNFLSAANRTDSHILIPSEAVWAGLLIFHFSSSGYPDKQYE